MNVNCGDRKEKTIWLDNIREDMKEYNMVEEMAENAWPKELKAGI